MRRHRIVLFAAALLTLAASFVPLSVTAAPEVLRGDLQFAELNRLRDRNATVTLDFPAVPLDDLFRALSGAAGFEVAFAGEPGPELYEVVEAEPIPVRQALQKVASITGVRYRVPEPGKLIVVVPEPAPEDPERPRLAGVDGVTLPVRIEGPFVKPVYPQKARDERVEGRVILQAIIDPHGTVKDLEILNCNAPGHGFEDAAIDAVREWRYEPATLNGEPVAVYFTIRMEFDLR